MKIIRAEHLGMCFGVRDAIALARREAAAQPLTVLGELVHNEAVLDDLRGRGVHFVSEPVQAKTHAAMITAHGASDRARVRAQSAGLTLRDATCPLVHYAHEAVRGLVKEGWHPVIVGRRGHVEVRGLTEDLGEHDIVLNEADVMALKKRMRFGIAAQTTQPIARVRELVQLLQERFPDSEVRFVDTVCRPTKQRQSAAVELARRSDVVIVVGGANSNNTAELVRTCGRDCERVHHVRDAGDLDSAWLAGAGVVGLTAGTSTPDEMIDAVEARLRELAVQHSAKAA